MVDIINHTALSWWSWMAAMFWQVSLLIVIIACIDTLIKRWAWPRLRYALWLLVLVKLVLPPGISMPGSFISSLQPMAGRVVESMTRERPVFEEPSTEIPYEHYQIVPAVMNTPQRTTTGMPPQARTFDGYASGVPIVESEPSVRLVWQSYAFVLWLLGIIILGSWLISRLHQLRKTRPQIPTACSIPQSFHNMMLQCARQLKLRRIPRIVVTKKVVCPAVFGVFRPVLLMPKGYLSKLSRKDAEHMLLHELAHIKRGDPVIHSFYLLLQIVYWFNPLLWLARRQLVHLRELCCDATVAGLLKNKTCEYRETLIDVARRFLTRPVEPGIGLLGLFEDTNRLLVRLSWLEKKTWRYQKMKNIIVITIVTLMIAFVLPMAVGHEAPSDEDYFVGSDSTSRNELSRENEEKDNLVLEMQALKAQLEKLDAQKQNLQKELATLEKSRLSAEKFREQALEIAKKEKVEKDKAQKFSAEAKKHKQWAEQWTNSEEFKQWQKELEKWSQQIQKLHQNNDMHNWAVDPNNKEAFMKWHQGMQQLQNSDEFKNWQKQMGQWQSKMHDWQKQMQSNADANAGADEDANIVMQMPTSPPMPPMPKMPPLPSMPEMPSMPPMPEDSIVSVQSGGPDVFIPDITVTPKVAPSVAVVREIKVPVDVVVPVVTSPHSGQKTHIEGLDIKVEGDKDSKIVATKEMEFTTKVEPGTPFVVRNKIGKIILNPGKDRSCTVKAFIRAKADTEEQAQEIIEQVSMKINSSGGTFYYEPIKVGDDTWEGLNVDLQITVPSGVSPDISTDVGDVEVNNLKEGIKGLTNVGSIKAVNVIGNIQLTTQVGDIEFVAREGLSAKIRAATKVGTVKSDFPLEIEKKDYVSNTAIGTVSSGENDIRLITEVGKINIRKESKESSGNSSGQSISVRTTSQSNTGTGKSVAAQLSSAVKLSDAIRTVQSIKEDQEGERYIIKRNEVIKKPLLPGSVLDIANVDGTITIQGSDTSECLVSSVFTIKAPTLEAAREFSKNVTLDTTTADGKLSLKAVSPRNKPSNLSFIIDLNITVPSNTSLELKKEDGNLQIKDVEGQMQIGSEDGNIICENITSDIRLVSEDGNVDIRNSHLSKLSVKKEDGNIHCDDISGNCDISLEDGTVTVSYADGTTGNCTCIVRGEDGGVHISKGTFADCQVKRESGKIKCDKVSGNLSFKLESGMVDVNYVDILPESCSINVKLDEGSVRLSAPGGMFPADSPSKASRKDEGAEWNTKVSTSGGSRTVNLKVGEGSIKIDKR